MARDFAAELQAARAAEDWAAHERIWEDRRQADIARDEAMLTDASVAYQEYLDSQSDPALLAMELAGDRGPVLHSPEAYDEMVRHDAEGRS